MYPIFILSATQTYLYYMEWYHCLAALQKRCLKASMLTTFYKSVTYLFVFNDDHQHETANTTDMKQKQREIYRGIRYTQKKVRLKNMRLRKIWDKSDFLKSANAKLCIMIITLFERWICVFLIFITTWKKGDKQVEI